MTYVYPVPILEISLCDPLSQSPEWVDITQWCKQVDTTYGRQHELQQIEAQTIKANMDNVTGLFSSWNFSSPFTNLLDLLDSTFEEGQIGNWLSNNGNTEVQVQGGGIDGAPSLLIVANGSGTCVAANNSSNNVTDVTPGVTYTGFASLRSLINTRNFTVGIQWYNGSHVLLSTSTSSSASATTAGFTKATITAAAPAGAVTAAIVVTVSSVVLTDVFFMARPGLTQRYTDPSSHVNLDINAWGPGGYGLCPGKPMRLRGTFSATTYPVAFSYIESLVPTISNELMKVEMLNCADGLKYFANQTISSSLYPGLVRADGANLYWRCGDPAGSVLVSDFSQHGNLGQISNLGTVLFQQPGLINSDANNSVFIPEGEALTTAFPQSSPPIGQAATTFELVFSSTEVNAGGNAPIMWYYNESSTILLGIYVAPDGGVLATIGGTTSAEVYPLSGNICDGTAHHIALTYNNSSGAYELIVDGSHTTSGTGSTGQLTATLGTTSLGLPCDLPKGQFIQEVAVYATALAPTEIAAHYDLMIAGFTVPGGSTSSDTLIILLLLAAAFPIAMISAEVGISQVICPTVTLGSTTLISVLNQIVATEQGLLYQDRTGVFVFLNRHYAISAPDATNVQATFENSLSPDNLYLPSGFQPSTDDIDLWNDIPTQINGTGTTGVLHDVQDVNSIARFGKRTLQGYTAMLYADDGDCIDLGEWLLASYSVPYARIRQMQVSSVAFIASNVPAQLALDLLDLIGVIYTPQDSGDAFNQDAQIESIKQSIVPGVLWLTNYQLTPYLYGSTFWFTLDDSVNGVLAGVGSDAANRLAF